VTASQFRVRSFAKINLALAILGRRPDGFHEIQTIFQTIDLSDELEFEHSSRLELHCEGLPELPVEENLVWRAAMLLSAALSREPQARITLRKRIPAGAGLGGGSSNAAVALLGLLRLWNAQFPGPDLFEIAASLGSDVTYFLRGGTALGVGRGERLRPLPELHSRHLTVIYPGVHISTAEAYRSHNLGLTSATEDHRIQGFCGQLQDKNCLLTGIFNDFEASILPAYPAVSEAKNFLKAHGAAAALLSGSGSSVFGFFPDEESALAASRLALRDGWRAFPAKTLSRAEYFQQMFG
jgi:4-diphosphocytidyl-2-C-methyl-D-erythritol kinase